MSSGAAAAEQGADVNWVDGRITDEGIAAMQSRIGELNRYPAWNREVTADNIWHFALGIGDDNPLWWNEDYAKHSKWGGLIAPPCYLYSHTSGPRLKPGDGRMSVEVFLPGVLGLWAGERWRWHRPVRIGEKVQAVGGLIAAEPREGGFGGRSVRQIERMNLLTEEDELVAEIDHIIMRFERGQTRTRSSYLGRDRTVWGAEDRRRFQQQYDREPAQRRGGTPRYIEDVQPGDPIDRLLKGPLTVTNIVGFLLGFGCPLAPANRIHHQQLLEHPGAKMIHPVTGIEDNIEAPHWDRELARASGMPDGYDFGAQRFSWLSHLISDWAGDDGFLKEMDARMLRPNVLGDVTWLDGRVASVDRTSGEATLVVTATNQLNEMTARATATVLLPHKPRAGG